MREPLRIGRIVRAFVVLIFAGSLLALSSCEAVGVIADKAQDPTVKAKYKPKDKDPILVLVESWGLSLDSGIEAQHMTLALRKAIVDAKVAPLVDEKALETLRDVNPDQYPTMNIAEIGRKTGAKQVLYVNIWRADVSKPGGSGQMRGQMNARVKVVDCQTGETRWPAGAPSDEVQITTAWIPTTEKTESELRADMADQMAGDIEKLFHDYTPDEEPLEDSRKVNVDQGG
jgi:hypothetical protein